MTGFRNLWNRTAATAVMGTAFLSCVVVTAAEPLDSIPADVSVVIRLKAPEATTQKLVQYGNQISPAAGPMLQQFAPGIGVVISNPAQAGVDAKRDWWVAVFLSADAEPDVLFAIPASDINAMKEALGESFQLEAKGDWAFYSESPTALKRLGGNAGSAETLIAGTAREVFDAGDLSIYVHAEQLTKTYAAQLDAAQAEMERELKKAHDELDSEDKPALKNAADAFAAFSGIARDVFQAIRDARSLTIALSVQPDAVQLEELFQVRDNTATDKRFAAIQPADTKLMSQLPPGKLAYFGLFSGMRELADWGMSMATAYVPQEGGQREQVEKLFAELKAAEFQALAGAFWLGDLQSGLLRSVTLSEVRGAPRLRETQRKLADLVGNFEANGIKGTQKLDPDAETYDDLTADVITTKQEISPENDPLGIVTGIYRFIFGPDGLKSRVLYDENTIIQVTGTPDDVKEVLAAYKAGEPSDSAAVAPFVQIRRKFPDNLSMLAMIDLGRLLVDGAKIAASSGQLPIPVTPEMLQGLRIQPSYLAFGCYPQPHGYRARLILPSQQLQGLAQIGMFAQQMMMQLKLQQQNNGGVPDDDDAKF